MQKNKLLLMTILAALLVCSAFSIVAADEQTETASATAPPDEIKTTEPTVNPDETINPDDSRSLDKPVSSGDDILYTIQDDNVTNSNETSGMEPEPVDEDAQLYAAYGQEAKNLNANDNTALIVTAVGIILAVAVGGAIGVVYFRKTKA